MDEKDNKYWQVVSPVILFHSLLVGLFSLLLDCFDCHVHGQLVGHARTVGQVAPRQFFSWLLFHGLLVGLSFKSLGN